MSIFPAPLPLLVILLSLFYSGSLIKAIDGHLIFHTNRHTWCVASPSATRAQLSASLDYACSRIDCSMIQQGTSCFYPNTYTHHASFAMNLYYQIMGRHPSDCDFRNSSLISLSDPSFSSCIYKSEGALVNNTTSSDLWPFVKETWCVPSPTTSDGLLQENINYACNYVNCADIMDGGSCFRPTTLMNHAAVVMNLYYQNTGRSHSSCDFHGTGLIVSQNPSYGECNFVVRD